MKTTKLLLLVVALTIEQFSSQAFAAVNVTVNGTAFGTSYTTLAAAITAIGTTTTGVIDVAITASTTETAAVAINAGAWTTLTIHPTVTGVTINGASSASIKFGGAQNVIIDGSIGGNGTTKDMTINNSTTTSGAIAIFGGSSNNTIRNCVIKADGTANGIIYMYPPNNTTTPGDCNNTISNNDITTYGTGRPRLAIIISGKDATKMANGNKILNNNIYNVCPTTSIINANASTLVNATLYTDAAAVLVTSNTSGTEVSGNSIYQTTGAVTITPTASITVYGIWLNTVGTTSGINKITNNYIGGTGPLCAGSYTLTTSGASALTHYTGININSTATSATPNLVTGNTVKNITVSSTNNLAQSVYGINANVPNLTVDGNTIQNITNTSTNTATQLYGIKSSGSTAQTISNNTLNALLTNSLNISYDDFSYGLVGIYQTGAGTATISGNTVSNLTNTASTNTAIRLAGIILTGSNNNADQVVATSNFISSITTSNATSGGVGSLISGIRTGYNVTMSSTIVNNIVILGDASKATLYGIYDRANAANSTIKCYHNTVYITGTATSGLSSYGYYQTNFGAVKDVRNNIFVNTRSTSSANYPIYINTGALASSTVDYNDYYGGTYALIATDGDTHKQTIDPVFPSSLATHISSNTVVPSDFNGTATLNGANLLSIVPTDYLGATRTTSKMGAIEEATVITTPTIGSFTPTSAGNTMSVIITGTNLTGASAVSFGGTAATSFTVNSATQITAIVGSGTSGDVSVTTSGGTATLAGFTWVNGPTAPTNLSATNISTTSFNLTWSASTDDVGVTAYDVYKNGVLVGSTANGSTTTLAITGLNSGTSYTMTVKARNATGNTSVESSSYIVQTIPNYVGNPGFESAIEAVAGNWSWWFGLRSTDAPVFAGTYSGKVPGGSTGASLAQVLNATLTTYTTYIFSANFRTSAGTVSISLKNFRDNSQVGRDAIITSTSSTTWVSTGNIAFKTGGTANNTSPTISIFAPAGTTGYADNFSIVPYPTGDTQAPTVPTNLSIDAIYDTSFNLTWTSSTDNNAIIGYEIYVNGALYATANPAMSSYYINGLTPSTTYTITMKAVDGAGLKSDASVSTDVTTMAAITGTNLVVNPGFETGVFTPWTSSTSAAISADSPYEGLKCGSVGASGASSTMTQTITGLQSNTKYILRAKYAAGGATFGVKNYLTSTTGDISVALPVSTPVPATATWVSTPNIVFTTGAARTVADVYATTPSNVWARFDNFYMSKYLNVYSFTPTTATTGVTVTITGVNFTGATAVSFGGKPATSFTVVNPTTITAVVPAGTSGSVSVTTPDGTDTKSGFVWEDILNVSSAQNSSDLGLTSGSSVDVLEGGELIINGTTEINNITIQKGGKVTVAETQSLTVNGDFNINSDALGTGTFVDYNPNGGLTINGAANVQQYLTGYTGASTRAYWYLSSPVSAATTATFDIAAGTNKMTYYDETIPGYVAQFSSNSTSLGKGVGYVTYIGGADAAYTFTTNSGANTAKLNTGTITLNPTRTGTTSAKRGFNLVGNPYPSFLDWNAVQKTNVRSTIWYRTYTGSFMQFDTFDGTNGTGIGVNGVVNQFIPPMQAFWVKVTADGLTGSLIFDNTMRSHQNQNQINRLRLPSVEHNPVLRLKVSNGVNGDEALVVVNSNATDGFDSYDSPKMTNDNANIPEIYTLADNEEIVINNLSGISEDRELTLGFRTGASNVFTLKASQVSDFNSDTRIVLKDNLLNTERDITDGTVYSFSSDVTNTSSRFKILFKTASLTTGDFNKGNANQLLYVFRNATDQIVINCDEAINSEGMITVSNSLGQKLVQTSTTGASTVISKSFGTGVYLVTIHVAGKSSTKKVIIN